jgi:ABC-type glycerol-3-phosphate transport system substrate-binding protein
LKKTGLGVPQTWEDMLEAAAAITTDDQAAIMDDASLTKAFLLIALPVACPFGGDEFHLL